MIDKISAPYCASLDIETQTQAINMSRWESADKLSNETSALVGTGLPSRAVRTFSLQIAGKDSVPVHGSMDYSFSGRH